jgi:cation:H+ antiporter
MSELPLWASGPILPAAVAVIALGAHWVVESAVGLSRRLGISELIIGLTVVALGTSAPEFAVTLLAAFRGQSDISVSNIVGSNIFNLGFILGGCALVRAIPTGKAMLRRDGLVIGAATVLVLVLVGWDLRLDRGDGALLFAMLGAYLALLFFQRHGGAAEGVDSLAAAPGARSTAWEGGRLLAGLVSILAGSHLLVGASTAVARSFGVSEWFIGVTIVAAGTSVPEMATSLMGVLKGRSAISVGSVIGSDIFNLLGVLGVAGLLNPMQVDSMARLSLAALCGMVLLVVLFMRTSWRITRMEGLALVLFATLRWGLDFTSGVPG